MGTAPEEQRHGVEIDWSRTIAGALAAVLSAVVLSTLGAAGTIIGAAIGSLVATVGGALFTQGITSSRRKLADAQGAVTQKVGLAQAEVMRAGRTDDAVAQDSHLAHAEEELAAAKSELDDTAIATAPVGWRTRLARLPWKRLLLLSLGLFVVAIVAITAFELVAGRSLSSITGGSGDGDTTIGQVTDRDRGDQPDETPDQTPGPTETVVPTQTTEPSPSESATPTESATPSESPTISPSTTVDPTVVATPGSGDVE